MTFSFEPGISTWSHIQATAHQTAVVFEKSPELHERANSHLSAAYEIADLVPENERRLFSGHFLPYTESYRELEAAALLACTGFYRQAFANLRTSMELALVGVYKDRDERADHEIKAWFQLEANSLHEKTTVRPIYRTQSYS